MVDFLLENAFKIVLIISTISYIFLIIWIKNKNMKFLKISASIFLIAVAISGTSYYIAFHSNYQSNKYTQLYSNEAQNKKMLNNLIEIKNSEENKNFVVFKEVINLYLNEDYISESDYSQILEINNNIDLKMALQYSKQEIEDLNILLKLTEGIE